MFCSISYTQFCARFFFHFIEASRSAAAVAFTQQRRREASLALASQLCSTLAPLLILILQEEVFSFCFPALHFEEEYRLTLSSACTEMHFAIGIRIERRMLQEGCTRPEIDSSRE